MIRLFSKGATASSCKVTILVHSVIVHSNGKAPGLPGEVITGHNTLTVAMMYPRGGYPLVVAATQSFAGPISDHLSSASGNEMQVIGRATLLLKTADLLSGDNPWIVTLPLIATTTIHDTWRVMTSAPGGEANYKTLEGDLTTAGQPNGSITLSITTSAP